MEVSVFFLDSPVAAAVAAAATEAVVDDGEAGAEREFAQWEW